MTDFVVPRCSHGNIILGCPHDDCPEQSAFLETQREAMRQYDEMMRGNARDAVRKMMGMRVETSEEIPRGSALFVRDGKLVGWTGNL